MANSILDGITVSESIAKSMAGQSFVLPYNRAYSLRRSKRVVFASDLIERPAFYIFVDPRLAKKIGMTEEEAFDLRGEFKLKEIESYYATKKLKTNTSENTTSKTAPSRATKSFDNGKGSADKAKLPASK